jgi:hypothetical protein
MAQVAGKCSPKHPQIVCEERYEAVRLGRFWWDHKIKGYVSLDIPPRETSWRGKYYNGDHTGEFYMLERCPWCSTSLPDLWPETPKEIQREDDAS